MLESNSYRLKQNALDHSGCEDSRMKMKRIKEEQRVVEQMIRLYCRKKEGNKTICPSCQELLQYAIARLERCKFGEDKPTCKKCPIHCYRPQMKERMCEVMRWAGPRMILYHPVAAIKHIIRERHFKMIGLSRAPFVKDMQ